MCKVPIRATVANPEKQEDSRHGKQRCQENQRCGRNHQAESLPDGVPEFSDHQAKAAQEDHFMLLRQVGKHDHPVNRIKPEGKIVQRPEHGQ